MVYIISWYCNLKCFLFIAKKLHKYLLEMRNFEMSVLLSVFMTMMLFSKVSSTYRKGIFFHYISSNEKMTISATKKKEFSTRYGCILNLDSEIMTIKYWVVGGARMRLEWNYIAMNVRIDKTLVTEITCYLLAVFYYVIFYSMRRI